MVAGLNAVFIFVLSFLARNAAVDWGGNTIVPISAVKDGKRSYAVYRRIGVSVK